MLALRVIWDRTKYFSKKLWGQLKKVPGWLFFVMLVLVGLLYFYVSSLTSARKKIEVQSRRLRLEIEKEELLEKINASETQDLDRVHIKYDLEIDKLRKREKELDEIANRGPIEIAKAWKEYLSR